MQGQGGADVEARGLELVGRQEPVSGGDPALGLDLPSAGVVQPGAHQRLVEACRERVTVCGFETSQPVLGAVDVSEQQACLGLEAHCGPPGRRSHPRPVALVGQHGHDGGHVVAGGDVDGGPDQLGLGDELVRLPGAVGGGGRADVLPGTVEVIDEQVAAGQSQADLTLLEAVSVVPGGDQRLLEGGAGAVDETGLEQHLGVVELGPVAGDRSVHRVGLTHQHQGPRQVAVDEGHDGLVVARLELLVDQVVGDGDVAGLLELGGCVCGVAQAEVALSEVEVHGPLLCRVERRLTAAHLFQGAEAGRPVAHAPVQGPLLDVREGHQQGVADLLGPSPGQGQHGQRRVQAPQLELGPRPGDEYPGPHPCRPRVVGGGQPGDGDVEQLRGLVEPAHLVRAAGGAQQLLRPLERVVLDEGLLRARWPG